MARILFLVLALVFALPATASAQSFNQQEQSEIRAIVRDYLVRNPDVLREALDALEERVREERWQRMRSDPRDFSMGPANAPIVIVEFFDYRCPHCHAALEWVGDIARTRRDVRIVFKELPILSAELMEASRAAIAALPQGRYWAFHRALMAYQGDLTPTQIDTLARQAGIDVARMRRAMDDPAIITLLEENRATAIDLNNAATPLFMINGEMVSGFNRAIMDEALREATRNVRNAQRAER